MISQEVLKKIRLIEIHTRRLLSGTLIGDYSSAQKGSGLEFDQIREYQLGDDIRFIDWKSSARLNKVLVKQYVEERSRTVLIVVDISSSTYFASSPTAKLDIMAQVASVLAFVACYGKDRVSLVLFSDVIECYIPPQAGRSHVMRIIEKLFASLADVKQTKKTSLSKVLDFVAQLRSKDAIVFLISDFIDESSFEKSLKRVITLSEVVAIQCLDAFESTLPAVGLLTLKDIETEQEVVVNIRARNARVFHGLIDQFFARSLTTLERAGVSLLKIRADRSFMGDLIRFFRQRMMY